MSKTEQVVAYIMQQLNQIGEDFGWQMGKVGANYENGYMKCNQDSKAYFRGNKIKMDIEKILAEHIVEVNEKIDDSSQEGNITEKNADKVRSMTDEELAEFIKQPCKIIKADTYPNRKCKYLCDECIEEWLKEKVE